MTRVHGVDSRCRPENRLRKPGRRPTGSAPVDRARPPRPWRPPSVPHDIVDIRSNSYRVREHRHLLRLRAVAGVRRRDYHSIRLAARAAADPGGASRRDKLAGHDTGNRGVGDA